VLYPGMLLPLHIFDERYRQLVRDLLERPEPRRFGVIAIRNRMAAPRTAEAGTPTLRRSTDRWSGRHGWPARRPGKSQRDAILRAP